MKHILLLLLLTCLPLCAATTYPMLSDTTNRTVTGGVTNLSFLNSNSVFTGTARWMGIVTLTNTGNIFVGDGAGLTGVGFATSGGVATNATIYGLTINTGSTNNALTGSRAMVTDANKGIISSATTATELGFVSGVTSALQTQIDAKAATSTLGGYVTNLGGLATNLTATGLTVATGQTNTHLTASSVVVTDANKGIVSGTTTADLATLSANQTFTGTNTFPAASFYPANNIGLRLLYSSPTNYFLATTAVSAVKLTNNGDYITGTPLWMVTIPALLGVRSRVMYELVPERTNAVSSGAFLYAFYVGANTNYIYDSLYNSVTTARSVPGQGPGFVMFENDLSMTNQINLGSATFMYSSNLVDTSVPWTLYLNCWATTTASTNILFRGLRVWEFVTP